MSRSILITVCALLPLCVLADPAERALLEAVGLAERGERETAVATLDALLGEQPDFHAAAALREDLVRGGRGDLSSLDADEVALLTEEITRRRAATAFDPGDRLPSVLLQVAPEEGVALVLDAALSRLYLFAVDATGRIELVDQQYSSVGSEGMGKQVEGDLLTPIGTYRITHHIPDAELPDLYGAGALPFDYPNAWDLRQGRTGYGIWLHGVPTGTYVREPEATRGCLAVSNAGFERWLPAVVLGRSPVVMAETLDWVERDELQREARRVAAAVEAWRTRQYGRLSHSRRPAITVSELSIQRVPGEEGLFVTTFVQSYDGERDGERVLKQLFWREGEDGRLGIVVEHTLRELD